MVRGRVVDAAALQDDHGVLLQQAELTERARRAAARRARAAPADVDALAPAQLGRPARGDGDVSVAVGAVAVVVGIYALTALVLDEPLLPSTVVIWILAAIAWHVSGDGWPAAACGAAAAVVGTTIEIVLAAAGVFMYDPAIDGLFGVPSWLPALYFAFGVVVSRLAEVCVVYGLARDGR